MVDIDDLYEVVEAEVAHRSLKQMTVTSSRVLETGSGSAAPAAHVPKDALHFTFWPRSFRIW